MCCNNGLFQKELSPPCWEYRFFFSKLAALISSRFYHYPPSPPAEFPEIFNYIFTLTLISLTGSYGLFLLLEKSSNLALFYLELMNWDNESLPIRAIFFLSHKSLAYPFTTAACMWSIIGKKYASEIEKALKRIEEVSCITFVKRTTEDEYLNFVHGEG